MIRSMRVIPAPRMQGRNMDKHLDRISPKMLQNKANSTVFGPCFCPIFASYVGVGLSGPVLRDTARLSQRYPPIARYGVFGVSTWPLGCDTASPFSERFPLGEHAEWRCDTPPQKRYLSDTCAIPYENKANGRDTPLCDTISKGYCAIWGGISLWAAKVLGFQNVSQMRSQHLTWRWSCM